MEFCECGSLKIGGSCTNKKCSKYVKKNEQISPKQISIIENLYEKLDRDYDESDLKNMSADEAQRLIYDLEDELEELRMTKNDLEEYDYLDLDDIGIEEEVE